MKEKSITHKDGLRTKKQLKRISQRRAAKALTKAKTKPLKIPVEHVGGTFWKGRRVAVLASGPSLTKEDAIAVRDAGFITIVVNNTWKLAPWYDVLMAGDNRWWRTHHKDIKGTGKRYSKGHRSEKLYKAHVFKSILGSDYNSGELAIEYAARKGPDLIVLLGFDGSLDKGIHWHGPHHHTPNPNATRCKKWLNQFARIPETFPDANIINCSRYTKVECFPTANLEDVLCELS